MLESLSQSIIQNISHHGYLAIFILMTLESALIPIPSEVTMPFGGFLAQQGHLSLLGVIIAGTAGNLLGSLIIYAIGYYLEENLILNLIDKYGKFLFIRKHDYTRSINWFQKYGSAVTFFSRLIPGIRTFISLAAGLSEMKIAKFALFTFLGCLVWSSFLAYLGFFLGKNWQSLHSIFSKLEIIIAAALILGMFYLANKHLKIFKAISRKDQ